MISSMRFYRGLHIVKEGLISIVVPAVSTSKPRMSSAVGQRCKRGSFVKPLQAERYPEQEWLHHGRTYRPTRGTPSRRLLYVSVRSSTRHTRDPGTLLV